MRRIETERLILRPFEAADHEAYQAIRAKPSVVRFVPDGEEGAKDAAAVAARFIEGARRCWESDGYGPWAAVERSEGRLIGHAGLRLLPQFGGETEILYMFDEPYWGRGYATEAATAARNAAFAEAKLPRVVALAAPENRGSINVMEKIGLRFERKATLYGLNAVCHAMDRKDWLARQSARQMRGA